MKFKDRREIDLRDGSVCVVNLHANWNKLGMGLSVYSNGRFYDQFVLEDAELPMSEWDITDYVKSYSFTGKTVSI